MTTLIEQAYNESIPYTIDWSPRLISGDTISSSSWAGSSSDFTLTNPSSNSTSATVWLTGGSPGNIYQITNTVVTANGLTLKETVPYVCLYQRQT